ncbi:MULTISPECIES: HAD family hydrolase [Burkholderia]|jgi:HAD superfamily hydrolase (TIGR01490 family)|uniref:HAD phosphoserine phosphatase-like hydrolase, IB family protein n=3 Tax=Burkholderia TaxID=32008 RepID=A0A095WCS0_BURGA|nr:MULTISPECIES: HAD family hydrolase [Burkholderia]AJW98674.1 HAD phosphoserine phosphatase-like hydrolase, IB family protein [Burkholderia gladioli]ASD78157.1 phosphoserine phosphatase [Burkholderia gladioli pv. gladioli]AWY56600.1 phosphoserine phosphatase [Burkholderia gladioli pv. gladioli]AYQ87381.1 HAD-IB family hydrolase [Burkholderia gladioli]KGC17943.1 HAD phosphoserine phosphatase-like hydrolase, IB family protein [Burkholderia gladioli]
MTNLALFDLDHTLIPTDSDHEWGRFMIKLGLVDAESFKRQNDRFYADYKAGTLDIHAYLAAALAPLARHPRAQLDAWHEQYMQEVIRPAMLPAALELVRRHREAGDLCCIVTATNAFVTRPIADAFGVETLIACEVETVDGHPASDLTGRATGVPSFREGKIARTEAWLASLGKSLADFERSYFYSDSHNDIPLLAKVTDPVATNPDDTLRTHAREQGWRILDLFQPS